jgi:ATP-binding cassette subfamily F protein uup
VVTSLLVLEGDGVVSEQAGGYSDWEARGGRLPEKLEKPRAHVPSPSQAPAAPAGNPTAKKRKLSYKDQRELEQLPVRIEQLEQRQQALEETIAGPEFYQQDRAEVDAVLADLNAVQDELEGVFERWAELEGEDD